MNDSDLKGKRADGLNQVFDYVVVVPMYCSLVTLKLEMVPFDMMRYDNLVPATEEDAHKLIAVSAGSSEESDYLVTFRRFSMTSGGPTVSRYSGFGAEVVSWEPG